MGEGDSEEIVLPKFAEAFGIPLDPSSIAVVPLGGRHVNHFWRLLSSLRIPYITLLDLDRERHGGGWGRIKYAVKQLAALEEMKATELDMPTGTAPMRFDFSLLDELHKRSNSDIDGMTTWMQHLEQEGVFYSAPLDLDFMMLRSFPDLYLPLLDDVESAPDSEDAQALRAVLGKHGGDGRTYAAADRVHFGPYTSLFLRKGKPATHLQAMADVELSRLRDNAPAEITRLLNMVRTQLAATLD